MNTSEAVMKSLDDFEQKFALKIAEHSDAIMELKQRGAAFGFDDTLPVRGNLGTEIAKKFNTLRETYEATKSVSFKIPFETKALVSTAQIQSHATVPGHAYAAVPDSTLLLAALPSRPMSGVTTAHYSRFDSTNGPAGVQAAEDALKTETSPVFVPIAQNAITVAGWCPITEQALKTSGELESVVNSFLADQVRLKIDDVLISGTTATAWPFAGFKALATPYPSATYTAMADVVAEVVATMRDSGLRPDVVVLNAMGYLGLVLAKNQGGDYLTGSYLAEMPLMVHGCKVVFDSGIAVNAALIIDTRHVELGYSSDLEVTIGFNADDYVKNKRTIRAETSIIPIFRHKGAARLATPKP